MNDYRKWTQPVVIGSGQRLVREGSDSTYLRLLDRQAFQRDVIVVSYQPVEADDRCLSDADGGVPASTGSNTELAMAMLGIWADCACDQEQPFRPDLR